MGILDWLGLGGKPGGNAGKPQRKRYGSQERGAGHRGIGVGSTEEGKRDLSAENIAKWSMLTGAEVEGFLYDQELLIVHSTNVASAQYFIDDQKLMLEFLNGSVYIYEPITEEMAMSFVQAQSKGAWVWDNLRVRGEGGDHKTAPGISVKHVK